MGIDPEPNGPTNARSRPTCQYKRCGSLQSSTATLPGAKSDPIAETNNLAASSIGGAKVFHFSGVAPGERTVERKPIARVQRSVHFTWNDDHSVRLHHDPVMELHGARHHLGRAIARYHDLKIAFGEPVSHDENGSRGVCGHDRDCGLGNRVAEGGGDAGKVSIRSIMRATILAGNRCSSFSALAVRETRYLCTS